MKFSYGKREVAIERKVISIAQERGWLVRKLQWNGRRGAPDRIFIKGGICIFAEFKKRHKDLQVQQKLEARRLIEHGACVVRIDNIELGREIFS